MYLEVYLDILDYRLRECFALSAQHQVETGFYIYYSETRQPIFTSVRLGGKYRLATSFKQYRKYVDRIYKKTKVVPVGLAMNVHLHISSGREEYYPSFHDLLAASFLSQFHLEVLRKVDRRLPLISPRFVVGDKKRNLFAFWFPAEMRRLMAYEHAFGDVIPTLAKKRGDCSAKGIEEAGAQIEAEFFRQRRACFKFIKHELWRRWGKKTKTSSLASLLLPFKFQGEPIIIKP